MTEIEEKLWKEYEVDPNDFTRNALAKQYEGCIRIASINIAKGMKHYDNCYQYGYLAMIGRIIPKYDKSMGVKFTTYAVKMLQYHIMNGIKDEDKRILKNKYNYKDISLSTFLDSDGNEYELLESNEETPDYIVEQRDTIRAMFKRLDTKEKDMVIRYFWQSKGYTEISREMGISKQLVEQRIKKIINKLK